MAPRLQALLPGWCESQPPAAPHLCRASRLMGPLQAQMFSLSHQAANKEVALEMFLSWLHWPPQWDLSHRGTHTGASHGVREPSRQPWQVRDMLPTSTRGDHSSRGLNLYSTQEQAASLCLVDSRACALDAMKCRSGQSWSLHCETAMYLNRESDSAAVRPCLVPRGLYP